MKRFFLLMLFTLCAMPMLLHASEPGKDWEFYGSARMTGAYWDRSLWYYDSTAYDPSSYIEDQVKLKRMIWDLEWMSRFGAFIKKDKYGFRFEAGWGSVMRQFNVTILGASSGNPEVIAASKYRDGMVLRRLFGEWFINDNFTLLIGQEWCIANFFPSAQVFDMEDGLCYSGALFTGRKPQIKISGTIKSIPMFTAKAEFAIVKPDTFIVKTSHDWDLGAEELIPKIEGGATLQYQVEDLTSVNIQLVAGINRYNIVANRGSQSADATKRNLVHSECFAGLIDITLLKKARFSFSIAQGKNLASYGVAMGNPWGDRTDPEIMTFYPTWGFLLDDTLALYGEGLRNTFTRQGCAVINIKPLPFIAGEVGAGKVLNYPEDRDYRTMDPGRRKNFNLRWAWYANLQFTLLNNHLLIIPEYSFSDLGGNAVTPPNSGKWYSYGMLVQFDM